MGIRVTTIRAGVPNEYGQPLAAGTTFTPINDDYALSLISQRLATDTDNVLGERVNAPFDEVVYPLDPVGLSADGTSLVSGDGNRLQALGSTSTRRMVIWGDSHTAFHGSSNSVLPILAGSARGWWHWYNFFSGQRLKIVLNAGIGGESLAQIYARRDAVWAQNPQVISLLGGTNDVAIFNNSVANMISTWKTMADDILSRGIFLHAFTAPPFLAAYPGWSLDFARKTCEFNDYIRLYLAGRENCFLTDLWQLAMDTTGANTNVAPATGVLISNSDLHFTSNFARIVGQDIATNAASVYPPAPYGLKCQGDAFGSVAYRGNYYTNGLFYTDSNADGLANGLTVNQSTGTPTSVNSLTPRAGFGNWQVFTITAGAAGDRILFDCYITTSAVNVGDYVYAEVDIDVSAATNLRNVMLQLQIIGGSNPSSTMLERATVADIVNLPSAFAGTLRTYRIQIPAGTTALEAMIFAEFSAAGGATLRINGLQVRSTTDGP